MFGPILSQIHNSTQLIKNIIRATQYLYGMASSRNIIVYTCYQNDVGNVNTPISLNITYFRNKHDNCPSKNIINLVLEPKINC